MYVSFIWCKNKAHNNYFLIWFDGKKQQWCSSKYLYLNCRGCHSSKLGGQLSCILVPLTHWKAKVLIWLGKTPRNITIVSPSVSSIPAIALATTAAAAEIHSSSNHRTCSPNRSSYQKCHSCFTIHNFNHCRCSTQLQLPLQLRHPPFMPQLQQLQLNPSWKSIPATTVLSYFLYLLLSVLTLVYINTNMLN